MAEAWAIHRDSLREEWASEHGPGSRCFAEWFCEIVPKHGERATTRWWAREHQQHRASWLQHTILHTHCWPPMQEPEHVFLFRVGYISEGEYQEAKAIYDEATAGDEEFLEGVCQRAREHERRRRERLHEADEADCGCTFVDASELDM